MVSVLHLIGQKVIGSDCRTKCDPCIESDDFLSVPTSRSENGLENWRTLHQHVSPTSTQEKRQGKVTILYQAFFSTIMRQRQATGIAGKLSFEFMNLSFEILDLSFTILTLI